MTALAWFRTIYSALAVFLNLATELVGTRRFRADAILLFVLVLTAMAGSTAQVRSP